MYNMENIKELSGMITDEYLEKCDIVSGFNEVRDENERIMRELNALNESDDNQEFIRLVNEWIANQEELIEANSRRTELCKPHRYIPYLIGRLTGRIKRDEI